MTIDIGYCLIYEIRSSLPTIPVNIFEASIRFILAFLTWYFCVGMCEVVMAGENLCHKITDSYKYPGIEENDDDDDLPHSLDNHSGALSVFNLFLIIYSMITNLFVTLQIWNLA